MKKTCSVRGCRRRVTAKGFCHSHYQRHRTGRPVEGPIVKCVKGPVEKRLRAYIKVDKKTGCHLWTGHRDPRGYGIIAIGETARFAHRMAWESVNGLIPDGMILMHTCDNPPCCNLEHLALGTRGDNNRDRVKKGRGKGARALDLVKNPQWGRDFRVAAKARRAEPPQRIPSRAELERQAAAGSSDVEA
jgi:HNH endonuclease